MRWKAITLSVALSFSASAFPKQNPSEPVSDTQLFLVAQNLSYDGKHDEARTIFSKYQEEHPEDLLAPLRMGYDYLLDSRPKADEQAHADYETALALVNRAIQTFENDHKTCVGTDIQGIGGGTIDCQYVVAALYSLREAFVLKNETSNIHEMNDDRQTRTYAENSGSPQAKFLLGAHEYQANQASWKGIPIARFLGWAKIPTDRNDALDLVGFSLTQNTVFSDDTWFYVLKMEMDHKPGADRFLNDPRYSMGAIKARLRIKYPDNGMLK